MKDLLSFINWHYGSNWLMEIGACHVLLAGNTIAVDTLEEKGCLRNQLPIVVPATKPANVFVLYNTAWFNKEGNFFFRRYVSTEFFQFAVHDN